MIPEERADDGSPIVDILPCLSADVEERSAWEGPPVQDEPARLAALQGYRILDSDYEEAFDQLTRWAKDHFQVPIALISFIDAERQWFKSACGIGARETPRDVAFCNFTILHNRPMVVEDALEDPRFQDNPLVLGEPRIRFYAGAPIITRDGYALGTFCIVDRQPRRVLITDLVILRRLAALVLGELEQRRALVATPVDAPAA